MEKKGIDISHHQSIIDWEKVKAGGVEFAMIKAVEGSKDGAGCEVDPCFKSNIENAVKAGIDVGVYVYSRALSPVAAELEAEFLTKTIERYRSSINYPVVLDIESADQKKLDRQIVSDIVKISCISIELAGYYSMIYANKDWCANVLKMDQLKRFDLWLADYEGNSKLPCGIKQNSDKGQVPGITGNVDLDTANKDYPAIISKMRPAQEPDDKALYEAAQSQMETYKKQYELAQSKLDFVINYLKE